jgi:hypothetical protein
VAPTGACVPAAPPRRSALAVQCFGYARRDWRDRRHGQKVLMLDIVSIVDRLAPGLLRRTERRVCLHDAAKYLVFDGDPTHPSCVRRIRRRRRV